MVQDVPERDEQPIFVQNAFTFFDTPPLEAPQQERSTATENKQLRRLHTSLKQYVNLPELRRLAAERQNLYRALREGTPPDEVLALVETLSALLHPAPREQVKGPADVAALLMVEMGHLDQEELRTVLLDTKNRVQEIVTVYRGSLNTAVVRIGEVYKEAVRRNSAAFILAHNHPSGDPEPSTEDTLMTREVVEAGKLLDVECLDHLVIGQGRWVSMRERRLGFSREL